MTSAPRRRRPRSVGQHHGDLERVLLAAALRRLESGDHDLTLRSLARDAGVSPAAPYHHFGSKEGLAAAIAADGFARLAVALDAVTAAVTAGVGGDAGAADPAARLMAMVDRYLRFAREHGAHYRVMWSPALGSGEFPALEEQALGCFRRLVDAVGAVRPGLDEGDVVQRAALCWSLAHGYAALRLDGAWGHLTDAEDALSSSVAAAVVRVAR